MSWLPKYTLTDELLITIRKIGEVIGGINSVRLSTQAINELQIKARVLSTHASTSIEGNPLALTDVRQLLKSSPSQIRDTEREILNYNQALQDVYRNVKSDDFILNSKTIKSVQGQVVANLMPNKGDIGHYREAPVVIRDPRRPDAIIFIPPDSKDVSSLMDELLGFINTKLGKIDPIILAGLFHRQHVIIHPFMDGNGRTTRLITTAILGLGGLDIFDLFSFENFYNRQVTRYFTKVGVFGDYYEEQGNIDFTNWLEYFAEGMLDELIRVKGGLKAVGPRLEIYHQAILDYIQQHGFITQREYGSISTRSLASRKKDLANLVAWNLIEQRGKGRNITYVMLEQ